MAVVNTEQRTEQKLNDFNYSTAHSDSVISSEYTGPYKKAYLRIRLTYYIPLIVSNSRSKNLTHGVKNLTHGVKTQRLNITRLSSQRLNITYFRLRSHRTHFFHVASTKKHSRDVDTHIVFI